MQTHTLATHAACLFSHIALIVIHLSLNGQSPHVPRSIRDGGGVHANVLFRGACSLRFINNLLLWRWRQELLAKRNGFRRVEEGEG